MADIRRRTQVAAVIIIIAFAFLAIIASYEVVNYGHEVKWTFSDGSGASYYSTQFANGTVYVFDQGYDVEKVYALNPDGTTRWSTDVESQPVVAANGTIYVQKTLAGDTGPSFCAIDRSGRVSWSYEVANGSFWQTVLGPEGNIYSDLALYSNNTSYGSDFTAFGPGGALLWTRHFQYSPSFEALGNGTILMYTQDGNLTAFRPDGSTFWRAPVGIFASGALGKDAIYFVVNLADIDGMHADLYAVSLNDTLLWRYPGWTWTGRNSADLACFSNPIVDNMGTIYFTRYNATGSDPYTSLFAVNPNGTLRWEYRDSQIGGPAINNGLIVFASSSGLTALDFGGKVVWRLGGSFEDWYTRPAFGSDGTVYAAESNGNYLNGNGIAAVGENPIALEIGALILLPIIAVSLVVIWKAMKP